MNVVAARELVERYRSQAIDEVKGGYARELLGTIVGFSIPGSRKALEERLDLEAQEACARTETRSRDRRING